MQRDPVKTTGKKTEVMIKNKKRQNFSIDKEVSREFKEICNHMSINMSKLIERYMSDFIKENKNRVKE